MTFKHLSNTRLKLHWDFPAIPSFCSGILTSEIRGEKVSETFSAKMMQQKPAYDALYASDEFGRPLIILKEQEKKARLRGIEAHKVR